MNEKEAEKYAKRVRVALEKADEECTTIVAPFGLTGGLHCVLIWVGEEFFTNGEDPSEPIFPPDVVCHVAEPIADLLSVLEVED